MMFIIELFDFFVNKRFNRLDLIKYFFDNVANFKKKSACINLL